MIFLQLILVDVKTKTAKLILKQTALQYRFLLFVKINKDWQSDDLKLLIAPNLNLIYQKEKMFLTNLNLNFQKPANDNTLYITVSYESEIN